MKEYRRFVLLSSPRSGTHMVRKGLDSHPNICCLTEMFNPDYTRKRASDILENQLDETSILKDYIYQEYDPSIKAVGFCIHRWGANFGDYSQLWQMLKEDSDLYVISLKRRNLLRTYMSVQLQHIPKLSEVEIEPIEVNPEHLNNFMKKSRQKVREFNQFFEDHPILNIIYEDLCENYSPRMDKIQSFLGVPQINLEIKGRKRNNPPITEFIKNYDELKEQFKETDFEGFFDD